MTEINVAILMIRSARYLPDFGAIFAWRKSDAVA